MKLDKLKLKCKERERERNLDYFKLDLALFTR